MKIQAEAVHFSINAQMLASIQQKVSKLEYFFNRISEARVILSMNSIGLKKELVAEIQIRVPNGVIFIKESSRTFDIALAKALVGLKLQLLKYKAKRLSYGIA